MDCRPGQLEDRLGVRARIRSFMGAALPRFTDSPELFTDFCEKALADVSEEQLQTFTDRLRSAGRGWSYTAPDPVARLLTRLICKSALGTSRLFGGEHLEGLAGYPRIYMANHLSYSDANIFHALLEFAGLEHEADDLTVMVGPKVFHRLSRRVASLAFGTIKTPQSGGRASGAARMPLREVARIAIQTVDMARERIQRGHPLLVFPEGTRSRAGRMQNTLPAVNRYFDGLHGAVIVPVGIAGSERFLSVGSSRLSDAPVTIQVGAPIQAEHLARDHGKNRKACMDRVGARIAQLLPEEYRGAYAQATRA